MKQTKTKKQMILEVATRVFSRYGFAKTSMDEIAQEAQIAKGTVYYYFPSKADLFTCVVQAQAQDFMEEMRNNLHKLNGFEEKLRYFMHAPLTYVCEKLPLWVDGLNSIPFNFQQHILEFRTKNREGMLQLLMEVMHEGVQKDLITDLVDPDRLCEVINDWFLMGNLSIKVVDFEELLIRIRRDHETIMKLIMYGILKRG